MSRIDQFESVFKSAARTVYTYERIEVSKVLVVTDLPPDQAEAFRDRVRTFLLEFESRGQRVEWRAIAGEQCDTVGRLLELIDKEKPDLVATYRNLHSEAWRWPHSLGDHLDVLTQVASMPVVVLPRPDAAWPGENTDSVLAVTDHLAGDARLVNYAVRATRRDGELCLAHLDDECVFERYVGIIAKIPEIDTDLARETISAQLLKEPADYIQSCKQVLRDEQRPIRLAKAVGMGNHLEDFRRLIAERQVDLLVIHTRDEDQMAMHGMAYPLAVELRQTPILML